eukprot:Amastigsp_a7794_26.p3 type:complete len:110 gc:universal Amastigsp_a7794_26:959-630(-)
MVVSPLGEPADVGLRCQNKGSVRGYVDKVVDAKHRHRAANPVRVTRVCCLARSPVEPELLALHEPLDELLAVGQRVQPPQHEQRADRAKRRACVRLLHRSLADAKVPAL